MRASLFMSLVAATGLLASQGALGQQGTAVPKQNVSREDRIEMLEKMARAHQAGADCLRAGKTEEECRSVMSKECPMPAHGGQKGGALSCPMMEGAMHVMGGKGVEDRPRKKMRSQGADSSVDRPAADTAEQESQSTTRSGSSEKK